MKLSIALFLLSSIFMQLSAQEKIWSYRNSRDLAGDRMSFYHAKGNDFSHGISTTEKAPDGENSLALKMLASAAQAPSHGRQVLYIYPEPLTRGMKIKLSFSYKGSVNGTIAMVAALVNAPYKALGKSASKQLDVDTSWKTAELEFTASEDFSAPLAMPRMLIGSYPVGETLYFGPVKMELLQTVLPLNLNSEWKVLKNAGANISLTAIPSGVETVQLEHGVIDLQGQFPLKAKQCAILYHEVESNGDGFMQIGMAADWWFECFVNGEKVFDTMNGGNSTNRIVPEDQIFNFPVKKGKNILAVKVYSGSKGWKFTTGVVEFVEDPKRDNIYIVRESEQFRPIDMSKMLIKKGTALDFSELNGKRQDIGKLGRVIVNERGKFAFENAPNDEIRFFSFNFHLSHWRLNSHKWTHADIEHFADAIANQGYNMVRFHFLDRYLLGFKVHARPHKNITEAGLPQNVAEIAFDQENYDRFEYMVACFKQRGIYVNLDLMTSATGYSMAYRAEPEERTKLNLFFSEKYRKHWRVAAEYLMSRVNTYTGTALKDDPVVACVDFINEQDIQLGNEVICARFNQAFREWLERKYGSDRKLSEAWGKAVKIADVNLNESLLRQGDKASEDAGLFLIERMNEMTAWYVAQVREIGYKGIYNQWDMIMRTMEIPVRAKLPAIAQHTYFDHPNWYPTKGLVEKNKAFDDNKNQDMRVGQGSSLDSSYFRSAAAIRFLDRPFMITEYSHSFPNRYRHERGLYFASYAALQGWDCLTSHENTVRLSFWEPMNYFDGAMDPVSRASETVAALVWARRDVRESPHTVALELQPGKLFPKNYLAAIGDEYAKMSLLTKIGILYPDGKTTTRTTKAPNADLLFIPEHFSPLQVRQWYVSAGTGSISAFAPLLEKLRQKGILASSNKTDLIRSIYQSDTGELLLDAAEKTMQVVTPRLEGAILKKDQPLELKNLSIKSCSKAASIVAASLDKDSTLIDSARVLLIVSTNAVNSGMVFENKGMTTVFSLGTLPPLLESIDCKLELKSTRSGNAEVYALNLDGTRAEKINSEFKSGKLVMNLDTSKLKFGTPYFEIIYEN